jgi:hypothetical protein
VKKLVVGVIGLLSLGLLLYLVQAPSYRRSQLRLREDYKRGAHTAP